MVGQQRFAGDAVVHSKISCRPLWLSQVAALLPKGQSSPWFVLERLLVRVKQAIEAAPLVARGRSISHSARSRNK